MNHIGPASRKAYLFILLIGVLSFFADFTYEGARSMLGPYLASLQASALVVGTVTGFGELAGYGLRLFSGRLADASGRFWLISIAGYLLQMSAVPALALTSSWPAAAVLIILERVGKAIRNPPRDVMLSHAANQVGGYGWVFGLHEALDQLGALGGPLAVAAILARGGSYHEAFAVLAIPAALNLSMVFLARWLYPTPEDMEKQFHRDGSDRLPRVFWLYLGGAGLVALGFADYPVIAYHFSRAHSVPGQWIAVFYAVAMGTGGAGSLVFGRLFDRYGFRVLIALTLASAFFAPLVFLGNFWGALLGAAIWGLGMGVHESIIPAAVAPMVSSRIRASAFGIFTAGYGGFWFLGSVAIGALYGHSIAATITFCMAAQFAAIPIFALVGRRVRYR
jgi:MFS family permease